jgi:hypothetical protein
MSDLTVEEKKKVTDKAVKNAANDLLNALEKCGTDRISCTVITDKKVRYSLTFQKEDPLV